MKELIDLSRKKLQSLELEKLAEAGITIIRESHAQSHHTVSFPEMEDCKPIKVGEIFNKSSDRRTVSLYAHMPFCTGKCTFCHYLSFPRISQNQASEYLTFLEKEAELLSDTSEMQNAFVGFVYFGGGTPTYLSPENLKRLLAIPGKFNLQSGLEVTLETAPETILGDEGEEKLEIAEEFGVNRINVGIQSFDNPILGRTKRRYNSEQAIRAIETVKRRFSNVNIDLIPGLVNQTLDLWGSDLAIASSLGVPSITTYSLRLKPESEMYQEFIEHPERFPSSEDGITMHIMAREVFGKKGYQELPIYWFVASPEHIYKQQVNKWQDNGEMVGIGHSAYSWINGWQYYNFGEYKRGEDYAQAIERYAQSLREGRLPISKGIHLTINEQAKRNLVLGIKCGSIDKEAFREKYGLVPEEILGERISRLKMLGLVETSEAEVKLTYKGGLLAEEVARCFAEN